MPVDIVDPVAFNVERSSGGQGGRGLEARSGDKAPWRPGVLPGMAGVRDNLQQPVEHRLARRVSGRPWTAVRPSAGASGPGDEAGVLTQATASPYGQPGPLRRCAELRRWCVRLRNLHGDAS
jgi:hypothetical protein